jgi:hypothetical protein
MKKIISLILLFISLKSFSQNSNDLKFKVVATQGKVKIFPEDNFLFVDHRNKIKIRLTGSGVISEVMLQGGSIKGNDSLYIARVTSGEKALLSVYETLPGGKKVLAATKQYIIIQNPEVTVNGVGNDSTIDKLSFAGGRVKGKYNSIQNRPQVISFKMSMLKGQEFVNDSVTGDRFSKPMRLYIDSRKNGDLVYLTDIKIKGVDNKVTVYPALRLFVVDYTNPLQFGF